MVDGKQVSIGEVYWWTNYNRQQMTMGGGWQALSNGGWFSLVTCKSWQLAEGVDQAWMLVGYDEWSRIDQL